MNRKDTVPIGIPALLGVAGVVTVAAMDPQIWQLIVSAFLAVLLVSVDARRIWAAART